MKRFAAALILIAGAVFLWTLIGLFEMRFARGDVYPAYSTLRSDPLGAKAFYQSLARLDALDVLRNEKALDQFSAPSGTTLFIVGARDLSGSEQEITRLEQFVKAGGRVVIAFYPQSSDTFFVQREKKKPAAASPSPSASPPEEAPLVKFLSTRDVAKRWEVKFNADGKLAGSAGERAGALDVDPKISWHSALHFKDSGSAWQTIYAASQFPVVIERLLGEGTLVLASDSYFLSNEAMRRERHPAFLAWLVGKNRHIVFDETHLGISENPGISTLIRRYRLGGLFVGLVVLAVLAAWKNAARLVPATETKSEGDKAIVGKESFAGFVNLLRRNVAPAELLPVCLAEWTKFLPRETSKSKIHLARANQIVEQSSRDPVGAYREIADALTAEWKPHRTN